MSSTFPETDRYRNLKNKQSNHADISAIFDLINFNLKKIAGDANLSSTFLFKKIDEKLIFADYSFQRKKLPA